MFYSTFDSLFCKITVAGDEAGLKHLHLNTGEGKRKFQISDDWTLNDSFFQKTREQIEEYLSGKRKKFSIKCSPEGTDFQKKVWNLLREIPFGMVKSYKDIAIELGNKNASRAVGMANGKNPIPLIIPCHRVVGASGALTGFAHGISIKKKLIDLESRIIRGEGL